MFGAVAAASGHQYSCWGLLLGDDVRQQLAALTFGRRSLTFTVTLSAQEDLSGV